MSNINIKSLDWEALLHESSDDEHDSDETLCEYDVSKVSGAKSLEIVGSQTTNVRTQAEEDGPYAFHPNISIPNNRSDTNELWNTSKISSAVMGHCDGQGNASEIISQIADLTLVCTEDTECKSEIKMEVDQYHRKRGAIGNESYEENRKICDGPLLQSKDCYFGISTESLENIIESDFIEDNFDEINETKRNTNSPPLIFTKNPRKKRNATSNKMHIPEKILPKRSCKSKYKIQMRVSTESEESSQDEFDTFDMDTDEIKTGARRCRKRILQQRNHPVTQHNGKAVVKKIKRNFKTNKTHLQNKNEENTTKVSFVQNLKEMEIVLKQTEENAFKWVNGEIFLPRENAFEMLMETQKIIRTMECLKVPMRCNGKLIKIKNILCERAKKLALAIDGSINECDQMINECDQMFKRECYEKPLNEKYNESSEEMAEIMEEYEKHLIQPEFLDSNNSIVNSFINSHDNCSGENTNIDQVLMEKENLSVQNSNIERPLGYIRASNINEIWVEPEKVSTSTQYIKNIPKSILKYSTSENLAPNSTSSEKHISFSDEIEFRYLSCTTPSSAHSSGQISTQQPSDGMNINTSLNMNQDSNTNLFTNVMPKNEMLTSSRIHEDQEINKRETCSKLLDNFCKPSIKTNNVQDTLLVDVKSKGLAHSIPKTTNKFAMINNETQQQQMSIQDVNTKGDLNSEIKNFGKQLEIKPSCNENLSEHLYQTQSTTSISENSNETFGFSEETLVSTIPNWDDVSVEEIVLNIEHIRVKNPGEYTPADQDVETWHDLDLW